MGNNKLDNQNTKRRMTMTQYRPTHFGSLTAVLALLLATMPFAAAQSRSAAPPPITVGQLAGTWLATLSGVTGCGTTTLTATFTLDSTGNGTQTSSTEHTASCGDIDLSGQTVQIQSLNANGSGFVAFGCGTGCGFGFNFQVPHQAPVAFNMGAQPVGGNYLAGVAFKR
jgi:hypothetical protein